MKRITTIFAILLMSAVLVSAQKFKPASAPTAKPASAPAVKSATPTPTSKPQVTQTPTSKFIPTSSPVVKAPAIRATPTPTPTLTSKFVPTSKPTVAATGTAVPTVAVTSSPAPTVIVKRKTVVINNVQREVIYRDGYGSGYYDQGAWVPYNEPTSPVQYVQQPSQPWSAFKVLAFGIAVAVVIAAIGIIIWLFTRR